MEKILSNISCSFFGLAQSLRKPSTQVIVGVSAMMLCLTALLAFNLLRLGAIAHGVGARCADLDNFSIFTMILLSACFSFCALMCIGEALHAIDMAKGGKKRAQFIRNSYRMGAAALLIGLGGSFYISRFCV